MKRTRWRKREFYIFIPESWSGRPVMNIPKPTILQGQGLKAEGQWRGQRKGRKGKKKDEIHGFDLSM